MQTRAVRQWRRLAPRARLVALAPLTPSPHDATAEKAYHATLRLRSDTRRTLKSSAAQPCSEGWDNGGRRGVGGETSAA